MEGKGGFQRPPTSMPSTTSRQRCPEASPGYVRAVARSSTRKAAPAVRPLSRRRRPIQASCSEGRHQCGVNGKLHTAPQKQAIRDDFHASLVLGTTFGQHCDHPHACIFHDGTFQPRWHDGLRKRGRPKQTWLSEVFRMALNMCGDRLSLETVWNQTPTVWRHKVLTHNFTPMPHQRNG